MVKAGNETVFPVQEPELQLANVKRVKVGDEAREDPRQEERRVLL